MQTIVPMVAYEDGVGAIEWLTRAFGFHENAAARHTDAEGRIGHAELDVGDGSVIFVAMPSPHYEGPKRHRDSCDVARRWLENPWVVDGLMIHVDDVDAHAERARAAGAAILRGPENVENVGRLYTAEDVEGHRWMFVQPPGSG